MTGKQLKNSILQWAIQGKLVPQDPNDEPASVLLEKIRAEKARLIKEGKIKKDKKESIIFRGEDNSYYEKFADGEVVCIDDEIPFEIPFGWEWCRLNGICYLIEDCPHSTVPDEGNGYPLVRTPNVGFAKLELNGVHRVCEETYKKRNARATPQHHDLIFAREAPAGNIAVIEEEKVCLGQRTVLVRPVNKYINPYYLAYYILSPLSQKALVASSTGTTVAHVNLAGIRPYIIAIPPYSEQIRIVDKIKHLLPFIDKYGKCQIRLDKLNESIDNCFKKTILQEAIQGKLVPQNASDEPASILLQRIKEEKQRLVKEGKLKKKDVVDSVIYRGDDNKYYEQVDSTIMQLEADYTFPETWGVARLAHICRLIDGEKKEGNYVCLDAKYLRGKSPGDILPKGKFVSTGDNIILVDGENSGEVFAVPHDGYMGSTFKQLWVSRNMHLPYVLYFIQFYKDLLRNSKKGAAIPHLNKEIFYSLVIGIPPYKEQIRIADIIDIITSEIKG